MKIQKNDMFLLYRQIAFLLGSGLPVETAFRTLLEESEDRRIRKMSKTIDEQMKDGRSIYESLGKLPKIFNAAVVDILKQHSIKKDVSNALYRLADSLEKAKDTGSIFYSAVLYPVTILVIAFVVLTILMAFVVPVFQEMFASMGGELPLPTRLVIMLSQWVQGHIPYIFIGLVAVWLLFFLDITRKTFYRCADMVPFFNKMFKQSSIIQFSMPLSILLSLDVPFERAIQSSAGSVTNLFYRDRIKNAGKTFSDINRLKDKLKDIGLFSKMMLQMIRIGAKTDSLSPIFEEISKYNENTFHRSLKKFTFLLEIVLLLLVGIVVGSILISVYLPIFTVAGTIG